MVFPVRTASSPFGGRLSAAEWRLAEADIRRAGGRTPSGRGKSDRCSGCLRALEHSPKRLRAGRTLKRPRAGRGSRQSLRARLAWFKPPSGGWSGTAAARPMEAMETGQQTPVRRWAETRPSEPHWKCAAPSKSVFFGRPGFLRKAQLTGKTPQDRKTFGRTGRAARSLGSGVW